MLLAINMKVLDQKYVLHIPVHKYEDKKLTRTNIEEPLEKLIQQLHDNGYTSFYKTKVTGYYKNREFEEILFTIFTSSHSANKKPSQIFSDWFNDNNHLLGQESFAYEENDSLVIKEL